MNFITNNRQRKIILYIIYSRVNLLCIFEFQKDIIENVELLLNMTNATR